MAKGKRSSGKHYASKSEVGTNRSLTKEIRREYRTSIARKLNQQKAWRQLKNVILTIPNPNTNETNKRFIRVSARDVWGNPGHRFIMKTKIVEE
jgi:hypothetical protein